MDGARLTVLPNVETGIMVRTLAAFIEQYCQSFICYMLDTSRYILDPEYVTGLSFGGYRPR